MCSGCGPLASRQRLGPAAPRSPHGPGAAAQIWMDVWQKMAPTPEKPDLSATALKTVRENADLLPKVCLGALFGFFTDDAAQEQIITAYSAIADVSRDEAAARVRGRAAATGTACCSRRAGSHGAGDLRRPPGPQIVEFLDTTFDLLPESRKDLVRGGHRDSRRSRPAPSLAP